MGYLNTFIDYNEFGVKVKLYNTTIYEVTEESYIFNTDGFKTVTTKRRMNQISEDFNLGFEIYQKNYCWFVYDSITNKTYKFGNLYINTSKCVIPKSHRILKNMLKVNVA